MKIDYPPDWHESEMNPEQISEFLDDRTEQAIFKAAQEADDDLLDLLDKAIEHMSEKQANCLLNKVHQIQSEAMRDLRGWK